VNVKFVFEGKIFVQDWREIKIHSCEAKSSLPEERDLISLENSFLEERNA